VCACGGGELRVGGGSVGEWHDFFVADAGASAAPAGLIFVGISIGLDDLIKYPHLLNRAAGAFAILIAVLVASSLMLAPGLSNRTYGVLLVLVSVASWLATPVFSFSDLKSIDPAYRTGILITIVLRQLATVPIAIAGIVVI
jgi:hypothetical protein